MLVKITGIVFEMYAEPVGWFGKQGLPILPRSGTIDFEIYENGSNGVSFDWEEADVECAQSYRAQHDELLAAAKEMVSLTSFCYDSSLLGIARDKLKAAIAKAEGKEAQK